MQASETKLQQIIEGTKQYVVPLFQRPYSWKKSEWQMLWDDLLDLCELETPRTHFMGSIVTMPTNSIPEGVRGLRGNKIPVNKEQWLYPIWVKYQNVAKMGNTVSSLVVELLRPLHRLFQLNEQLVKSLSTSCY